MYFYKDKYLSLGLDILALWQLTNTLAESFNLLARASRAAA